MQIEDCLHDSFLLMTIPEIIAVVTGVWSVWFARKESILVYPVGIVSVLLYVYICLEVKLYADAAINAYYFAVSLYGWYYWKYGGKTIHKTTITSAAIDNIALQEDEVVSDDTKAQISVNEPAENLYYALGTVFLAGLFGYLLNEYTDSTVPFWDGGTTAIFFVAMLLMAKKKIENWVYWIIGDIICIPLFFSKGLCLSSLQYVIFTVIAIAGLLAWIKKRKTLKANL